MGERRMLNDSSVIIEHLRHNEKAAKLLFNDKNRTISVQAYMEVLQGIKSKNKLRYTIAYLTETFQIKGFKYRIGVNAIKFLKKSLSDSEDIGIGDAIIAATAYCYRETLCTANFDHFKKTGIKIERFIP